ncbi:MAG: hypothetical protein M3281_08015 [Chloroflexota bacterium]|nr:hypothetical protein [Chloroflexota bacterium]
MTLQVIDVSGEYEDLNVVVFTDKLRTTVRDGDTVLVSGTVAEAVRTRTTTGETVLLPAIYAETLRVVKNSSSASR